MLLLAFGCSSFLDPGCSSGFALLKEQVSADKLACSSSLIPVFVSLLLFRCCCTMSFGLCGLGWKIGLICVLGCALLLV
jgi:hypothetical protein